jgi:uncharacterized protein DUF4190
MTHPPTGDTPDPYQPQQPYGPGPDPTTPYSPAPHATPAGGQPSGPGEDGQPGGGPGDSGQPGGGPGDSGQPGGEPTEVGPDGGGQAGAYSPPLYQAPEAGQPGGFTPPPYPTSPGSYGPSPYGPNPGPIPYGPNPYGPGPYGPGPYGAQQPYPAYGPQTRTNALAIASLACSLGGLITCLSAPVGIALGHIAKRQIRETGEQGDGLATAGLWVGYILTILGFLLIAGWLAVGVFLVNISDTPT